MILALRFWVAMWAYDNNYYVSQFWRKDSNGVLGVWENSWKNTENQFLVYNWVKIRIFIRID